MPRGNARNRRPRLNSKNATDGPDPVHESQASKKYRDGKTIKYKWRVAGPVSEVKTYKM